MKPALRGPVSASFAIYIIIIIKACERIPGQPNQCIGGASQMPKFAYTGVTPIGETVSGEVKAQSRDEAIGMLRRQKVRLWKLQGRAIRFELSLGIGRVKLADVSRFTRQLSAMTSAGLPLVQCMDTLSGQSQSRSLAGAAAEVSGDIKSGMGLAQALRKHSGIFNDLYCNMVAAGEAAGNLPAVLTRLAEYQEKANTLRRRIRAAMTYPLVLAAVAALSVVVLLTYVVPRFAEMFVQLGSELPAATQTVLAVSGFMQSYGLLIMAACAVVVFGLRRFAGTPAGRAALDTLKLRTPLFGELVRKNAVARFSHTLGTLLRSGVDLVDALVTTAKTAGNSVIEKGLVTALENVKTGHSLAAELRLTGLFPPMVLDMVGVGEKTGDLAGMLDRVSEFYKEEVDASIEALTSIVEPVMVVIMGIIICMILYAMYLPMFDVIDVIS